MAELKTKPLRELVEARRDRIKEIVASHRGLSVRLFGSVDIGTPSSLRDPVREDVLAAAIIL